MNFRQKETKAVILQKSEKKMSDFVFFLRNIVVVFNDIQSADFFKFNNTMLHL